jgi:hypothetical protein
MLARKIMMLVIIRRSLRRYQEGDLYFRPKLSIELESKLERASLSSKPSVEDLSELGIDEYFSIVYRHTKNNR